MTSARELLGPEGPFARAFAGYEARSGQLEMADAVQQTLAEEGILLCEAGTGIGKTLAYLVPAIQSNKKVVVSTATRSLQDQIVQDDLPLIERTLGLSPRVAVMKGLSNYVCRRRLYERSLQLLPAARDHGLPVVADWASRSASGDIAELASLSEDDPLWAEVTSSSDTRVGAACRFYEECFVTAMRREAEQAQVVVVNHHLFFADLALRGPHPGRVLPNYDAVIFDEAHQIEDIATDYFGVRTSTSRLERLARDAERALGSTLRADPSLAPTTVQNLVGELRRATQVFFQAAERQAALGEARRELPKERFSGELHDAWLRLDSALLTLRDLACELSASRSRRVTTPNPVLGTSEALDVAVRRADAMRTDLGTIAESGGDRVTWFERSDKSSTLSSSPVDVAELLKERIFEQIPAVVLTSATLTTAGSRRNCSASPSFAFLRARLGLTDLVSPVSELVVQSPFDFQECALLYTPRDLPSPAAVDFEARALSRVQELVSMTGGGAFVLTTSLRRMRQFGAALQSRFTDRLVLVQGDAPKAEILRRFRSDGHAVLVATASFWEGVDVPGQALRLVVMDKLPFLVPTDPLVRARSTAIEEAGGNAFMDFFVPSAAIALKQGFGRLIRTRRDIGVVALLDERLHRRGYGQRLLDSLPPARRTDSLEKVQLFCERIGAVPTRETQR